MQRQVPFLLLSHILFWFAVANDVESLPTLQDQCLEFDIADLEGYVSTFDLAKVPTVDAMFAGFEYPITALPFGFLRSDWARLLLLRNSQPMDTILANKLERLFRILIVAYLRMEKALISNFGENKRTDGNATTLKGSGFDTSTTITGNIRNADKNRGDMDRGDGSEQDLLETVTIEFNRNDRYNVTSSLTRDFSSEFMTIDFWNSRIKPLPSSYVDNSTESASVMTKMEMVTSTEDSYEGIIKEAKNEKERGTFSTNSTPMNNESTSLANSTSTRKSNNFETSTKKFHSLGEWVLWTTKTEGTTSPTINFHDSDDLGGNRNIEEFSFTTSTDGTSASTETSSNEGTDLNGFDTDREKIKSQERLEVSFSEGVDTSTASITRLPEKSEKFVTIVSEGTSTETSRNDASDSYNFDVTGAKVTINDSSDGSTDFSFNLISSTSSEMFGSSDITNFAGSVNTEKNIKASVNHGFSAFTEAPTKSARTRSGVNDVTNRWDIKGTTSTEVSTWRKNNPVYKPNVARDSMDRTDPMRNTVYDVFGSESESDIDESRPIIGNKMKRLPVSREQPPGNIMKDYKETVQRDFGLVSKTTTTLRPTSSMEDANESKEYSFGSRKRAHDNTGIENNFKFFYNGGRGPSKGIRINDGGILDFIRVQCGDETT